MRYNANDYIIPFVLVYLVVILAIGARCSDGEEIIKFNCPGCPTGPGPRAGTLTIYEPDQRYIVHNTPSRGYIDHRQERLIDWTYVLGHVVYGASSAFDNYQTAKNLGTCAFEGNPDLGRNPSNRDIAVHASVEFAAVVVGDLLIRWYGSRHGIPRWLNMAGGNLGSSIGTGKHIRGGMQWVNLCH